MSELNKYDFSKLAQNEQLQYKCQPRAMNYKFNLHSHLDGEINNLDIFDKGNPENLVTVEASFMEIETHANSLGDHNEENLMEEEYEEQVQLLAHNNPMIASSNPNFFEQNQELFDCLYENSNVNLLEALLSINVYIERYNLSDSHISGLLKLFHFLLPSNKLPKTSEKLKKILDMKDSIKIKKYCSECGSLWNPDDKSCQIKECISFNKRCFYDSFSYCSIYSQLANTMKTQYNSYQQHSRENVESDITNSIYYQNLKKSQKQPSLNLMITTDDISLIKCPTYHTYPVCCSILEFPNLLRNSIKNSLISAVWYGKNKPSCDILFSPLLEEKERLENGLLVNINGENKVFYVYMYGFISDLPAKALSFNVKQYNGHFGCTYCIIPDLKFSNELFQKRTYEDHLIYMKIASPNKPVYGVKGYSPLAELVIYPDGCPLDYMHLILEGAFKSLCLQLFSVPDNNETEVLPNIRVDTIHIQRIINKIKYPSGINRDKLDIRNISRWKASQYRIFLFYIAPIVLYRFMHPTVALNFISITLAIRLLHNLNEPITSGIEDAENLLKIFFDEFEGIYRTTTLNTKTITWHMIKFHLIDDVKRHGSLAFRSMFFSESFLGYIKNKLHGNRSLGNQFIQRVVSNNILMNLIPILPNEDKAIEFIHSIRDSRSTQINHYNTKILKPFELIKLDYYTTKYMQENLGFEDFVIAFVSQRMLVNGVYFTSENYGKKYKTDNYNIMYLDDNNFGIGKIVCFYCKNDIHFAKIICYYRQECDLISNLIALEDDNEKNKIKTVYDKYFFQIQLTDEIKIINVKQIICKIIVIDVADKCYGTAYNIGNEHD